MKKFIVYIPDEINFLYLEDFLIQKFDMGLLSVGCGSTEYWCKKKPKDFSKIVKKELGQLVFSHIRFMNIESGDKWIKGE